MNNKLTVTLSAEMVKKICTPHFSARRVMGIMNNDKERKAPARYQTALHRPKAAVGFEPTTSGSR